MATDIHIHVDDGLTQEDYSCFFASQIGSVYFQMDGSLCRNKQGRKIFPCEHEDRILAMPHVFAGESFWPFPAHLPESEEEPEKLPDPTGELVEAFPPEGELPVTITKERIEKVRKGVQLPEELAARYGQYATEEKQLEIVRFLEEHKGKGAFLLFH